MRISGTSRLADLFAVRSVSRGRFVEALECAMPALRADMELKFPGMSWTAVCDAMQARLPSLLEATLPELFVAEWAQFQNPVQAALPETVEAVRMPAIELLRNGLPFTRVVIKAEVALPMRQLAAPAAHKLVPISATLFVVAAGHGTDTAFHDVQADVAWPDDLPTNGD